MPGFFERLGRILAPLPEDLPPPTPPSKTFSGRIAQLVAPDDHACRCGAVAPRARARVSGRKFTVSAPRAKTADTLAAGVEESKAPAPMDLEPMLAAATSAAAAAAPPPPGVPAKTPLKIGIRISGANWEDYNAKHNVEQLIAEITGEMIRAQADSPVKFMYDYLAKTYPHVAAK